MVRTHRALFNLTLGSTDPIVRLRRLLQIVHDINTALPGEPPILIALEKDEVLQQHPNEKSPFFGDMVMLFGTEQNLTKLSQRNQEFMRNIYYVEKSIELPNNMTLVRRLRPRRNKDGIFENTKHARWIGLPSTKTRQYMTLAFGEVEDNIALCDATTYGTCKNLAY